MSTTVADPMSGDADAPTDAGAAPELPPVVGSLSPSRAADFKNCPLLFRFRTIDKLPEPPSSAATRGTLVHDVLERLFDLPAAERTLDAARSLLPAAWARVVAEEPEAAGLFADDDGTAFEAWLASAGEMLQTYFRLEDPTRLEPAAREELVEVVVDGLRLRGYIDRLDVSPAGDLRVVDYKTGASPREAYESRAMFQLKFYALVLWRTRGVVPRELRLIYLADGETLTYRPDDEGLHRFEGTLKALWAAIVLATEQGDFQPNPGSACTWCSHQDLCPAYGGTPPPYPAPSIVDAAHYRPGEVTLLTPAPAPPSDAAAPDRAR
ncbi:MAG: RecB family exonuclease [Jatrophihabitans sp.]|uniref:RecB family exonuclease n=1 Tax=Jatrophihabitans sp. TaxID=1932789 RepID=UPI003F7EFC73